MDFESRNTRERPLIALLRSSPSVDGNLVLRDMHERSLISLLRSSPSSTSSPSSSSSSYYSRTRDEDAILPLSSPAARTGSEALPQELNQPQAAENVTFQSMGLGFRLVSFVGQGGLEWKNVERRFDQIASYTGNGTEPVVKWSGFGYCIGESWKLENFIIIMTR